MTSFFSPPPQRPSVSQSAPRVSPKSQGLRGTRHVVPPPAPDVPVEPDHKAAKKAASRQEVVHKIRGCLFKVNHTSWFDLDGYFCVRLADKKVRVTRTANRKVMASLTAAQKRQLHAVRTTAGLAGIR